MPQPRVQFVAGVVILCIAISGIAVLIPLMWTDPRYCGIAPIATALLVVAMGITAVQGGMATRSALKLFRGQKAPPGRIQLAVLAAIAFGIVAAMWAFSLYVFTQAANFSN